MNTNPSAKRILCYGDSNTWGSDPTTNTRYDANVRWTGVLQKLLGNDYEIIEEGLPGRTTNIDEPGKEWRNGKSYLIPCLESHDPLDLIIITLGTNDLKSIFNKSAEEIMQGLEQLIELVDEWGRSSGLKRPKIIIVAPASVDETHWTEDAEFLGATEKSKQLAPLYKALAQKHNCDFIDLDQYVETSEVDGVHLSDKSHTKIAEVLYNFIVHGS